MGVTVYRPVARALLLVLCLGNWCPAYVNARLTNVVTDWIEAPQQVAAFVGAHEVTTSRWYALVSVAIYNSVVTGRSCFILYLLAARVDSTATNVYTIAFLVSTMF